MMVIFNILRKIPAKNKKNIWKINLSVCSKKPVFSTEAYASDVRFFKTLQLDEARV